MNLLRLRASLIESRSTLCLQRFFAPSTSLQQTSASHQPLQPQQQSHHISCSSSSAPLSLFFCPSHGFATKKSSAAKTAQSASDVPLSSSSEPAAADSQQPQKPKRKSRQKSPAKIETAVPSSSSDLQLNDDASQAPVAQPSKQNKSTPTKMIADITSSYDEEIPIPQLHQHDHSTSLFSLDHPSRSRYRYHTSSSRLPSFYHRSLMPLHRASTATITRYNSRTTVQPEQAAKELKEVRRQQWRRRMSWLKEMAEEEAHEEDETEKMHTDRKEKKTRGSKSSLSVNSHPPPSSSFRVKYEPDLTAHESFPFTEENFYEELLEQEERRRQEGVRERMAMKFERRISAKAFKLRTNHRNAGLASLLHTYHPVSKIAQYSLTSSPRNRVDLQELEKVTEETYEKEEKLELRLSMMRERLELMKGRVVRLETGTDNEENTIANTRYVSTEDLVLARDLRAQIERYQFFTKEDLIEQDRQIAQENQWRNEHERLADPLTSLHHLTPHQESSTFIHQLCRTLLPSQLRAISLLLFLMKSVDRNGTAIWDYLKQQRRSGSGSVGVKKVTKASEAGSASASPAPTTLPFPADSPLHILSSYTPSQIISKLPGLSQIDREVEEWQAKGELVEWRRERLLKEEEREKEEDEVLNEFDRLVKEKNATTNVEKERIWEEFLDAKIESWVQDAIAKLQASDSEGILSRMRTNDGKINLPVFVAAVNKRAESSSSPIVSPADDPSSSLSFTHSAPSTSERKWVRLSDLMILNWCACKIGGRNTIHDEVTGEEYDNPYLMESPLGSPPDGRTLLLRSTQIDSFHFRSSRIHSISKLSKKKKESWLKSLLLSAELQKDYEKYVEQVRHSYESTYLSGYNERYQAKVKEWRRKNRSSEEENDDEENGKDVESSSNSEPIYNPLSFQAYLHSISTYDSSDPKCIDRLWNDYVVKRVKEENRKVEKLRMTREDRWNRGVKVAGGGTTTAPVASDDLQTRVVEGVLNAEIISESGTSLDAVAPSSLSSPTVISPPLTSSYLTEYTPTFLAKLNETIQYYRDHPQASLLDPASPVEAWMRKVMREMKGEYVPDENDPDWATKYDAHEESKRYREEVKSIRKWSIDRQYQLYAQQSRRETFLREVKRIMEGQKDKLATLLAERRSEDASSGINPIVSRNVPHIESDYYRLREGSDLTHPSKRTRAQQVEKKQPGRKKQQKKQQNGANEKETADGEQNDDEDVSLTPEQQRLHVESESTISYLLDQFSLYYPFLTFNQFESIRTQYPQSETKEYVAFRVWNEKDIKHGLVKESEIPKVGKSFEGPNFDSTKSTYDECTPGRVASTSSSLPSSSSASPFDDKPRSHAILLPTSSTPSLTVSSHPVCLPRLPYLDIWRTSFGNRGSFNEKQSHLVSAPALSYNNDLHSREVQTWFASHFNINSSEIEKGYPNKLLLKNLHPETSVPELVEAFQRSGIHVLGGEIFRSDLITEMSLFPIHILEQNGRSAIAKSADNRFGNGVHGKGKKSPTTQQQLDAHLTTPLPFTPPDISADASASTKESINLRSSVFSFLYFHPKENISAKITHNDGVKLFGISVKGFTIQPSSVQEMCYLQVEFTDSEERVFYEEALLNETGVYEDPDPIDGGIPRERRRYYSGYDEEEVEKLKEEIMEVRRKRVAKDDVTGSGVAGDDVMTTQNETNDTPSAPLKDKLLPTLALINLRRSILSLLKLSRIPLVTPRHIRISSAPSPRSYPTYQIACENHALAWNVMHVLHGRTLFGNQKMTVKWLVPGQSEIWVKRPVPSEVQHEEEEEAKKKMLRKSKTFNSIGEAMKDKTKSRIKIVREEKEEEEKDEEAEEDGFSDDSLRNFWS